MRNAPSVNYPVGRCRFLAVIASLLALSGFGVLMLWWTVMNGSSVLHMGAAGIGAVLWLVWAIWATRDWRRTPQGRLEWDANAPAASLDPADGQEGAWCWRDAGASEAMRLQGVELAVDLQFLILLRLQGAGRCSRRWVWVEHGRDSARWPDLRRAIHSSGH